MYVARILYPVEVLGPGKRIGIWMCGCPRRCVGCSNPELWQIDKRYFITTENVVSLIKEIADKNKVDGFTLTGGEPFLQPHSLFSLISKLRKISNDILVYTGYRIEQLKKLDGIAVLIDGRYIKSKNDGSILRGSSNQRIHILDKSLEPLYEKYISAGVNGIQNFTAADGVISVGIHNADYGEKLDKIMAERGATKFGK